MLFVLYDILKYFKFHKFLIVNKSVFYIYAEKYFKNIWYYVLHGII